MTAVLQRVLPAPPAAGRWRSISSAAASTDPLLAPGMTDESGADANAAAGFGKAVLHGSDDRRPLEALKALIELAEESQNGAHAVQWGWCR